MTLQAKIRRWIHAETKLLLLLLATHDLAGQDPSMDPCGDSDGKKA
jgi:hypothetical protein